MKTQLYPKQEKLKHKKEISLLFEKGKWKSHGNLRIIFLKVKSEALIENSKFGVSVSKRYFKKAVDRNRVKRLLRECYRLHKDMYIASFGSQSLAMLFWVSNVLPSKYEEVEKDFLCLCKSKK